METWHNRQKLQSFRGEGKKFETYDKIQKIYIYIYIPNASICAGKVFGKSRCTIKQINNKVSWTVF